MTAGYFEKYAFLRKMFLIKVIDFRGNHDYNINLFVDHVTVDIFVWIHFVKCNYIIFLPIWFV